MTTDRTVKMIALLAAAALVFVVSAEATTKRSAAVAAAFQRLHPCPSTHKKTGSCPGWIKDHVIPLCKGGPDAVTNMQWQTVAAAKAKDKIECRP